MLTRSPSAIGRAKWPASLARAAGVGVTVMRFGGRARPMAPSAPRTRSRDSPTALSGRPTTAKEGRPELIWTWTSTSRTSMPENATVRRWATPSVEEPFAVISPIEEPDALVPSATGILSRETRMVKAIHSAEVLYHGNYPYRLWRWTLRGL